MIALSILVAALVASSLARRHHSDSSTDSNEHHKAFIAKNIKSFENRLNTAVSKALLNGAVPDVRPFLKTYGINSDRTFDKTFELLDAIVKVNARKRNVESDDSSSSSSSSEAEFVAGFDQFLSALGDREKDLFRVAVLKQALVQHLQSGREQHHGEDVGKLLEEYDQWKQTNARLFNNKKAQKELIGSRHDVKALFDTSSDK